MRGPGGMDMGKLMKQAQKMQAAASKLQEDLNLQVVSGSAGGGAVVVEMTGGLEPKSVTITKAAVDPEDVETLEDLVLAALKDAVSKAQNLQNSQMSGLMGGMGGLPGFGG